MYAKRHAPQRGIAAVELALTLPILVTFVFSSIEVSNLIFLRQALLSSSYEAARVSIRNNATNASATASANAVLAARGISGATVAFNPSDVATVSRGTPITVTVTAPSDSFSIVPILDLSNASLSVSMNMVKE